MNKNIVVFGCDNTGKTNLTRVLNDVLKEAGVNVKIIGSIGKAKKETQQDYITNMLDLEGIKIFDRFTPIEEYVCGNVLRGKSNFNLDELKVFSNKVDLFVFCYPGLFNILNWGTREQMEGVKENALDLITNYNCMAVWLVENGFNVTEYNYNIRGLEVNGGMDDIIKQVLKIGGIE